MVDVQYYGDNNYQRVLSHVIIRVCHVEYVDV